MHKTSRHKCYKNVTLGILNNEDKIELSKGKQIMATFEKEQK